MNAKTTKLALSLVATVASIAASLTIAIPTAHAANAEIFEIDPSLQSRIAREKIKQRGPTRGQRDRSNNSDSDKCGQVDIGNNNTNQNSRSRVNPRVNVTVVQGPVINAARCR